MEWTKEKRYKRIDEIDEKEIEALSKIVNECPWRQTFHIQPKTGLLNDPNGFSFFNGEYHLFYQWFPLGPVHGLKYWYHTKSQNLVDWENIGIAIEPNHYFDSHGAYSGSAIENEGMLYLMYTGNTRDENWIRHPYQCMAVMDPEGKITKMDKPVISDVPNGYTDHFRDPKVWKSGETFYTVIGAQRTDKTGSVLLFCSSNLSDWQFKGEIDTNLKNFGYMWECPDYFELEDNGILIFSPQGLSPKGDEFRNIYQSGYLVGKKLDMKKRKLSHGEFKELDRGFDFYAPQTMLDQKGRRILVAWMGLPEIEYPTDKHGWAHCLTLPRELTIRNNKLIQTPVKELQELRGEKVEAEAIIYCDSITLEGFYGETFELIAEFTDSTAEEFGFELRVGGNEKTIIKYNKKIKKILFDRSFSGQPVANEFGNIRKCGINSQDIKFHVFADASSIEVFINDGEEVFTGRIFPGKESRGIRFFAKGGQVNLKAIKWVINQNKKD